MTSARCLKRSIGPVLAACLIVAGSVRAAVAQAQPPSPGPDTPTVAPLTNPQGRPKVVLDRLSFPDDVKGARGFKAHLKRTLAREVRRVDWGGGAGNRIEYRFSVDELALTERDGVLEIRCRASGQLPQGRRANSRLSFGGSPKERSKLIRRVLDIVARGVVTRLADLKRQRRGAR